MKKQQKLLLLILFFFVISSCEQEKKQKKSRNLAVQNRCMQSGLFAKKVIEPNKTDLKNINFSISPDTGSTDSTAIKAYIDYEKDTLEHRADFLRFSICDAPNNPKEDNSFSENIFCLSKSSIHKWAVVPKNSVTKENRWFMEINPYYVRAPRCAYIESDNPKTNGILHCFDKISIEIAPVLSSFRSKTSNQTNLDNSLEFKQSTIQTFQTGSSPIDYNKVRDIHRRIDLVKQCQNAIYENIEKSYLEISLYSKKNQKKLGLAKEQKNWLSLQTNEGILVKHSPGIFSSRLCPLGFGANNSDKKRFKGLFENIKTKAHSLALSQSSKKSLINECTGEIDEVNQGTSYRRLTKQEPSCSETSDDENCANIYNTHISTKWSEFKEPKLYLGYYMTNNHDTKITQNRKLLSSLTRGPNKIYIAALSQNSVYSHHGCSERSTSRAGSLSITKNSFFICKDSFPIINIHQESSGEHLSKKLNLTQESKNKYFEIFEDYKDGWKQSTYFSLKRENSSLFITTKPKYNKQPNIYPTQYLVVDSKPIDTSQTPYQLKDNYHQDLHLLKAFNLQKENNGLKCYQKITDNSTAETIYDMINALAGDNKKAEHERILLQKEDFGLSRDCHRLKTLVSSMELKPHPHLYALKKYKSVKNKSYCDIFPENEKYLCTHTQKVKFFCESLFSNNANYFATIGQNENYSLDQIILKCDSTTCKSIEEQETFATIHQAFNTKKNTSKFYFPTFNIDSIIDPEEDTSSPSYTYRIKTSPSANKHQSHGVCDLCGHYWAYENDKFSGKTYARPYKQQGTKFSEGVSQCKRSVPWDETEVGNILTSLGSAWSQYILKQLYRHRKEPLKGLKKGLSGPLDLARYVRNRISPNKKTKASDVEFSDLDLLSSLPLPPVAEKIANIIQDGKNAKNQKKPLKIKRRKKARKLALSKNISKYDKFLNYTDEKKLHINSQGPCLLEIWSKYLCAMGDQKCISRELKDLQKSTKIRARDIGECGHSIWYN